MRARDDRAGDVGHDGLVDPLGAFGGGGHDHGVEVAGRVGSAGGGVVVGRVVEGLDGDLDGLVGADVPVVALLEGALREDRARADGVEVAFGVDAADDVEAVDLAGFGDRGRVEVEPCEQGHDGEALERDAEVAAQHGGEAVGLAVQGERGALDLLVVLEFELVELHQLDAEPGRARDADERVAVGGEDLFDVAAGDVVAHGRAAVAGHDNAFGGAQGDDGGGVRADCGEVARRQGSTPRQQFGCHLHEELREGGGSSRHIRVGQFAWESLTCHDMTSLILYSKNAPVEHGSPLRTRGSGGPPVGQGPPMRL